jgi:glycosyltransferase involved in cell wall biosynthesis
VNKRIERDEANKGGVNGKKNYPKRDKTQYSGGMRFDIVVVLGMHRSGTSALAKALELFGVDLGQNLLAANEYNPKGYFEDNRLVLINDNILRKSRSLWSALQFLEPADLLGAGFEKEQNEAREFLKGKLAQGIPIGLKDPRLCRTLPLWEKIFVELGVRVGYLMAFRNPFEIAASLGKRDGMAFDYGLTLWGSYQTDALRHTEGKSRLFVGFHQLLENSERELTRISKFLETTWNPDAQSALEYEKKFLDSDLRHHLTEKRKALEPAPLQALAVALDAVCQKSDKKELEDVGNAAKEALLRMMQVSDLIRKNNQNLLRSNSSVELFYSKDIGVFSEERKFSRSLSIASGSQEVIDVSLSGEVGLAPYWRLDPGCQPGMIHLIGMKFLNSKGHVVWDLQDHREQVLVQGTGLNLPFPPVGVEVISTGNDPIIILPVLPAEALPISSIHVDIEINTTQEELGKLVQLQTQKAAHLQLALGEKDSKVTQMKSILDENEMKIARAVKIDEKIEQIRQEMKADQEESKLVVKKVEEVWATSEKQNVSLQNTLSQIRQEMAADREESKLVVKKVEEVRATSEQQNVSLQNTLSQIRKEMAVDREESKLAVKKVEKGWTQQRKAQQEAVEKSVGGLKEELAQQRKAQQEAVEKSVGGLKEELAQQRKAQQEAVEKSVLEVKNEIVAEIQSLIANLVQDGKRNRLEVSARIDAVKDDMEGRIIELGKYAAKIQDAAVSPSSYLIPAPFSWYSYLHKMLSIRKPIWLNKEKESGEAPKRPGFWRRLERSIRKKRKRWIGGVGFDRDWYLEFYADVTRAGLDPLDHFIEFGQKEGRYKNHKQQAVHGKASEAPIIGRQKNLAPLHDILKQEQIFDENFYLEKYPDVKKSEMKAWNHFVRHGHHEGRLPCAIKISHKASEVSLSVVIPTYNGQEKISKTIEAISKFSHGMDIEIIIVNDGSQDQTENVVKDISKKIKNIKLISTEQRGAGAARNLGAKAASKEILLFIGDDISPLGPEFFNVHWALHKKNPEINYSVLGKVEWPDVSSFPVTAVMRHIQGEGGEQFGYTDMMPNIFWDWRFFYTCNVSVKRRVVSDWEAEGFDASFVGCGFEDSEFACRMSKKHGSFNIFYSDQSVGSHYHRHTFLTFLQRQALCGSQLTNLIKLHPECAGKTGVGEVLKILYKNNRDNPELAYKTLESIRQINRLTLDLEAVGLLGKYEWHKELLHATFWLAYLLGFLNSYAKPNQGYAEALTYIFNNAVRPVVPHLPTSFLRS